MKTYILAGVLSFGSVSAYSATILGYGQSIVTGGNTDCNYPDFAKVQAKAQKEADQNALLQCQSDMGTNNVTVKRVSEFKDYKNCSYTGPWYSTSVLEVSVVAKYSCN